MRNDRKENRYRNKDEEKEERRRLENNAKDWEMEVNLTECVDFRLEKERDLCGHRCVAFLFCMYVCVVEITYP